MSVDSKNNHSLGIGPKEIAQVEKEKQVEALLKLAKEKGIDHTIKVARGLKDPYALDRFHDEIGGETKFVLLQVSVSKSKTSYKEQARKVEKIIELTGDFKTSWWERKFSKSGYLGIEIAVNKKVPRLLFMAPPNFADTLEKIIYSVFPQASIATTQDYSIFGGRENVAVKKLSLNKEELLPLDTSGPMPILGIFRLLNKYSEEESFALQLLFYPKSKKWVESQLTAINKLKEKFDKKQEGVIDPQKEVERLNDLKEIELRIKKLEHTTMSANVRLVFASGSEDVLEKIDEEAKHLLEAPGLKPLNYLEVKEGDKDKDIFDFIFRNFNKKEEIILNSREIAWIIQFF